MINSRPNLIVTMVQGGDGSVVMRTRETITFDKHKTMELVDVAMTTFHNTF